MTVEFARPATVRVDARLLSSKAIMEGGSDGYSSPPDDDSGLVVDDLDVQAIILPQLVQFADRGRQSRRRPVAPRRNSEAVTVLPSPTSSWILPAGKTCRNRHGILLYESFRPRVPRSWADNVTVSPGRTSSLFTEIRSRVALVLRSVVTIQDPRFSIRRHRTRGQQVLNRRHRCHGGHRWTVAVSRRNIRDFDGLAAFELNSAGHIHSDLAEALARWHRSH